MSGPKTLVKMLGRGTTQAVKRVDTSATTAKVISILAGALVGNVLGRMYPTEFMGGENSPIAGTVVGGVSGWGVARLAEALGAFKADMETASDEDIKDHFENTPISAFVIPGYSTYYQQQLENKATTDDLMKNASVFSPEDIKKYRQMAVDSDLEGRQILDEYDDQQIANLANGIGPNNWSDLVVKSLNKLAPYAVPAAIIHDLEWSRGINNKKLFDASNKRFQSNVNKGISSMGWYNPLKYMAYLNSGLMKGLVDTNFKHYREGLADRKSAYLEARKKYILEAIDKNKKLFKEDSKTPIAEKYEILKNILESKDRQALYDSGYWRKSPATA